MNNTSKKEKKQNIRETLLKRRNTISKEEYLNKSVRICDRVKELAVYQNVDTVHCYVSMNERREVNTHPLIKDMLSTGNKVVVPVTEFESGTLQHIHITDFDQLKKNKWGVLEPEDGREVTVDQLDLVIVPMVGGDRQKNRLGYGKGFYDRFLSQVDCPAIGLLFETCLVDEIPVESFDVALDILITEKQIIAS